MPGRIETVPRRADPRRVNLCNHQSFLADFGSTTQLPSGATLVEALQASGVLERHPGIELATAKVGVWGKLAALDTPLRDGDRVELYRPLMVDPKEARRLRYRSRRCAGGANDTRRDRGGVRRCSGRGGGPR